VASAARPFHRRRETAGAVACHGRAQKHCAARPALGEGGRLPWFCFAFYTQMSANRKDNTTDGIIGLFNAVLATPLASFFIIFESRIRVVSTYLNRVRPVKT
jgi:hypothetical protein